MLLFSSIDFVVNLHGLAASLYRPNNEASHCDVSFPARHYLPWCVLVQPRHCLHEYRFQMRNLCRSNIHVLKQGIDGWNDTLNACIYILFRKVRAKSEGVERHGKIIDADRTTSCLKLRGHWTKSYTHCTKTSGSAMAEGPRDVLISRK